MKNGAISFDKLEVKFNLDSENNPKEVYFKTSKDANKLIEEFMLLANRSVAEFIGKQNHLKHLSIEFMMFRSTKTRKFTTYYTSILQIKLKNTKRHQ